jgi:hypothetical protein
LHATACLSRVGLLDEEDLLVFLTGQQPNDKGDTGLAESKKLASDLLMATNGTAKASAEGMATPEPESVRLVSV